MKKLLMYLKHYKKETVIAPLFKMLEATFELIVPVIMANIIDVGIQYKDAGYIYRCGGILLLLGALGLTCSLTAQYFAAKAALGFGAELRSALYRHINTLSHSEIDRVGTPSLITRLTSDVNAAQSGVNLVLRLFLRSPFIVLGAIVMALRISPMLTILFVITTAVLSLAIYWITARTIPLYRTIQGRLDGVSRVTRENLTGARVIRAFSRQEGEKERFGVLNQALNRAQIIAGRVSVLMNPVTMVIVNIAVVAVIWFGGITVNAGGISQGEVVALVNYLTQILTALIALANLIVTFTKAMASAARINEIFAIQSSIVGAEQLPDTAANADAVCFENVSCMYPGTGVDSISGISFRAGRGETIGVIGGTGSGKSTLVNLIPRFYDATDGRVSVAGANVKDYPLDVLREKIGVVPQKAALFKGSIRDNMRWGKADATDAEIFAALEIAQAADFVREKNGGLDEQVEQGGKNLSGGQRQRLTIARALVAKPEILLLDDSASALDFATDAALRRAIAEKTRGMTVFIVSQRATSIQNADRILVMDDGKLVGQGSHAQLLKDCDVYREICLSQVSESEAKAL